MGLGVLVKAQLARAEQHNPSPSGAHEQQHGAALGCGSFGVAQTVPSLSLYGSLLGPRLSRERHSLGDGDTAGLMFNIQHCRLVGQWACGASQDAYCACVAEALAFAVARNIWRRDIKLQNLLLNSQGHCKLADFGSAKVSAADRTWSCVETPEYRARVGARCWLQ